MSVAAPYAGSNPYIGEYDAYAAHAKTAYEKALARINSQRQRFLQRSGYDSQGRVMADNPFGGYQQMMHGLAGTAEEFEAANRDRGFRGGLARQATNDMQRQYEGATLDFARGIEDAQQQFGDAEFSAGQDYNNALFQKMQEITQRAISEGAFNTPNYGGIQIPGYPNPYQPNPGTPGLPFKPPPFPKKPKQLKRRRKRKRRR